MTRRLRIDQVRRVAIAAQGLAAARPARPDAARMRAVLDRLGVLQVDSVNVLARAHLLTLFARLGPYDPAAFDRFVVERRGAFEYWGHMASFNPIETWPLFRHRMAGMRGWSAVERLQRERPGYVEAVLADVAANGPLTAADLKDPGETRAGSWWDWRAGKLALEHLFARGEITVARRGPGFVRYYDLPQRVIPAGVLAADAPEAPEAHRGLIRRAIRSMGVATTLDLVDYYRIPIPAGRAAVAAAAAAGDLVPVEVDGWEHDTYADPDLVVPRRVGARALLCPFDSLIWYRERALRVFDFHYRIEIYTPKPKRRFGYYVLPFLLGDRIVGRVDLKADRKAGKLLVPGAFAEDGTDPGSITGELAAELREMARWLGLDDVAAGNRGELIEPLRRAL